MKKTPDTQKEKGGVVLCWSNNKSVQVVGIGKT